MTTLSQVTTHTFRKGNVIFPNISDDIKKKFESLDDDQKNSLRIFLKSGHSSSLSNIMIQAERLPDTCKEILEGTIFHEGFVRVSLLNSITNLPEAFERLYLMLNIH